MADPLHPARPDRVRQGSEPGTAAVATAEVRDLYRLLVETVRDYAIFLLDPNGIVSSWNIGAEKLKGYTREEIVGRHFSVFYPPEAVATGWPDEELRRARKLGR